MQCEKIQDKFIGFLDNDLRVTEQLCVEVHLTQCYTCREELDALKEDVVQFRRALRHPCPVNGFEALRVGIALSARQPRFNGTRARFRVREGLRRLAVAAILLLVAGIIAPIMTGNLKVLEFLPSDSIGATGSQVRIVWRDFLVRRQTLERSIDFGGTELAGTQLAGQARAIHHPPSESPH